MRGEAKTLNRYLKRLDSELFAQDNGERIDIFRNAYRANQYEVNGSVLAHLVKVPQWVLSLTDTWFATGTPRSWGIEPVLHKLRSMDAWTRVRIIDEASELFDKENESKAREQTNKFESIAIEQKSAFKKVADSLNLSNVKKTSIYEKKGV